MKSETSLACNMAVFTPAQREAHIRSATELFRSVRNIREVGNGFEFIFPNKSEIITGVAEFIANERSCCPFLEFRITVLPDREPVSLRLSGPEGTKEFLKVELSGVFA